MKLPSKKSKLPKKQRGQEGLKYKPAGTGFDKRRASGGDVTYVGPCEYTRKGGGAIYKFKGQ